MKKKEKRSGPRVLSMTLPKEAQPYLEIEGLRCAIHSFGHEGFEAWIPKANSIEAKLGETVQAEVLIKGKKHSVELKVIRVSDRAIGLSILKKSPELAQVLQAMLESTSYAHSLKPMPESQSVDELFGYHRLWYVGEGDTELVVWYNDLTYMILGIQVCGLGNRVFRQQFQPADTGILKEGVKRGQGAPITDGQLLMRHETADRNLLDYAAQFLSGVTQPLPGSLLWQFLETGEQVYLPRGLFYDSNSDVA